MSGKTSSKYTFTNKLLHILRAISEIARPAFQSPIAASTINEVYCLVKFSFNSLHQATALLQDSQKPQLFLYIQSTEQAETRFKVATSALKLLDILIAKMFRYKSATSF